MSSFHLIFFNRPHLIRDGTERSLRSSKFIALLAYLAGDGLKPHLRTDLASLFWPETSQPAGLQNLRQAVYQWGRAFSNSDPRAKNAGEETSLPFLRVTRATLQFCPDDSVWVDTLEFSQALQSGNLERALELYQGEFLAGFVVKDSLALEEWLLQTRAKYQQMLLQALFARAEEALARGDYPAARQSIQRQLTLEAWNEAAHRQQMGLLVLTGQKEAALAQFELCRQALDKRFAAAPTPETLALYHKIRAGQSAAPAVREATPPARPARLFNFPRQGTAFFGREAEQARLEELLGSPHNHLITIVGEGGSGKTRLAIQVAGRLADRFEHGAAFVPLAQVGAETSGEEGDGARTERQEEFLTLLAAAVRFEPQEGSELKTQLLNYLASKKMLLVLDNFEHLRAEAGLVLDIFQRAPGVVMLVTSRQRLNFQIEHLLHLEGLPVPPPEARSRAPGRRVFSKAEQSSLGTSSVQLFTERARRVADAFSLTPANLAAVSQICRFLNGSPLGIELAAAQLEQFDCASIAQQIRERLDFLQTRMGDLPARHQSLRAVFEGSWQMLPAALQATLATCAVFEDGFDGPAAQVVAGADLNALQILSESNLLGFNGERYQFHSLIRQFLDEKLRATLPACQAAQATHARYFLEFLAGQEAGLTGEDRAPYSQRKTLARCGQEANNLRRAWEYACEHAAQPGWVELLDCAQHSLFLLCSLKRWYPLGESLLEKFKQASEASAPGEVFERAMILQISAAIQSPRPGKGRQLFERGHPNAWFWGELSPRSLPVALIFGRTAAYLNDYPLSDQILRKVIAASTRPWVTANAHFALGVNYSVVGKMVLGWEHAQQALTLFRTLGDEVGLAKTLGMMAYFGAFLMRPEALSYVNESLKIYRELENQRGIADATNSLALVALSQGNYELAETSFQQFMLQSQESGMQRWVIAAISHLGIVYLGLGKYRAAYDLCSASLDLQNAQDIGPNHRSLIMGALGYAEYSLGLDLRLAHAHLTRALDDARRSNFPLSLVVPLLGLGELAGAAQNWAQARELYLNALAVGRGLNAAYFMLDALIGLAQIQLQTGEVEEARAWLLLALRHPITSPAARRKAQAIAGPDAPPLLPLGEAMQRLQQIAAALLPPARQGGGG